MQWIGRCGNAAACLLAIALAGAGCVLSGGGGGETTTVTKNPPPSPEPAKEPANQSIVTNPSNSTPVTSEPTSKGAGTATTTSTPLTPTPETFLLTIFLKHDQSMTLDQISTQLEATGFWKDFPPPGVEVVSWYVMMGIGQVVTLRVPPAKLRDVNLAIERKAWRAFRTEFYPTYDYVDIWKDRQKRAQGSNQGGSIRSTSAQGIQPSPSSSAPKGSAGQGTQGKGQTPRQ